MSIRIENVSKNYGKKQALKNVNLEIQKGKIIGLLGANGSGKSTLIKLINGLLTPTYGEVKINELKPGIESKRIISYLPERTYLDPSKKVIEIIEYFKDFYEDFDEIKTLDILEKLNIEKNDKLKSMSKGMREKVQLALVMSRKADFYILDEPIGGVDPASRDFILATILTSFEANATLIISTHLISEVEHIFDEVIFISNGKIILHENTDDLRSKHNKTIDAIFREEFRC